jgi:hypothetical protein
LNGLRLSNLIEFTYEKQYDNLFNVDIVYFDNKNIKDVLENNKLKKRIVNEKYYLFNNYFDFQIFYY